jgi:hypothetical protein
MGLGLGRMSCLQWLRCTEETGEGREKERPDGDGTDEEGAREEDDGAGRSACLGCWRGSTKMVQEVEVKPSGRGRLFNLVFLYGVERLQPMCSSRHQD